MSEQGFNGEQIRSVFIKVGAKSMAERVAGKPFFPAKTAFMLVDVSGKKKGINRPIWICLFWKEPPWHAVLNQAW